MKKLSFNKSGKLSAESKRALSAELSSLRRAKSVGIQIRMPREAQYALPAQLRALVPLSAADSASAKAACKAANPRKQNILSSEPCFDYLPWYSVDIEYKGAYRGYRGSNFIPTMKSYGVVHADGSVAGFIVGDKNNSIFPGAGYRWAIDSLGIKLVRVSTGAEYHPDSADVLTGFVAIRTKLLANEAKRLAAISALTAGITPAMRKCGTLIALDDATRQGNCRAGVVAFCQKIGIDAATPTPLKKVVSAFLKNRSSVGSDYANRFIRVASVVAARG